MPFTLGSLFDGSGGFPLAGSLCGIEPLWASEVEPYPIAVTRSRFPNMKHLGDISKINGAEIEPVDVITFGSPCQDLSVAGKRAGLKHEANGDEETTRSGLFMEAVRIIKEMRSATNGRYPTFALWENVPGAFSSNKGEDFRIVLEELIKIVEPSAVMPAVPKNGWPYADSYCGDGWSLAYRVFDAQYWGVPQRRRRIHLVLDLRGERARVLFESEGLRRNPPSCRTPWQGLAAHAQDCAGADDRAGAIPYTLRAEAHGNVPAVVCKTYDARGNGDGDTVSTLTGDHENRITDYTSVVVEEACYVDTTHADDVVRIDDKAAPLQARDNKGGKLICQSVYCLQGNGIDRADTAGCNGKGWKEDVCYTLNTIDRPAVAHLVSGKETVGTLMANSHPGSYCGQDAYSDMLIAGQEPVVFDKEVYQSGENATGGHYIALGEPSPALRCTGHPPGVCGVDVRNCTEYPELYQTLQAKPNGGQSLNFSGAVRIRYIVRRLTPTECARLQGFPDRWGDIDHKDDFTEEEYRFWHDVRNTHAAINGKKVQEYTKEQMLNWYNKLHTDSAEYKMWGNGIALPPALYCMQGMCGALWEGENEWLL